MREVFCPRATPPRGCGCGLPEETFMSMSALFHGKAHSTSMEPRLSPLDVRVWTVPRRRAPVVLMDVAAYPAWRTMLVLVLALAAAVVVLHLFFCCYGIGDVVGHFCAEAGADDCCAKEEVPCAGSMVLAGGGRWSSLAARDTDTGVGIGAAKGPVTLVGATGVERVGDDASSTGSTRGGERTTASCATG